MQYYLTHLPLALMFVIKSYSSVLMLLNPPSLVFILFSISSFESMGQVIYDNQIIWAVYAQ